MQRGRAMRPKRTSPRRSSSWVAGPERLLLWASGVGWGDVALIAWVAVRLKRLSEGALLLIGRRREQASSRAPDAATTGAPPDAARS